MDKLAYFDNAATTFPKPEAVYEFADSFYRSSGGNIGRGGNTIAAKASAIEREAKANLLKLYDCEGKDVVFTSSATDALNRILLGLTLHVGDVIYVSPFEHNAVTRTLQHLVETVGVRVEVLPFDKQSFLPDYEEIEKLFADIQPKLLVLTHASNVCGAVLPVEELCSLAKRICNPVTVVDMSQTAGLLPLDIKHGKIDFAVFAGHKTLLAPFGVGGFFCSCDAVLKPVIFGGNGIDSIDQDMPTYIEDMIEVGSRNTYAIAGLKASTDWILQEGMTALRQRENDATRKLLEALTECEGVKLVGEGMKCQQIGVVSCLFEEYSPDETEMLLGKFNVAVRSGIQCAPYAHRFLGTLPTGTVRFSVSPLVTEQDFGILKDALYAIMES